MFSDSIFIFLNQIKHLKYLSLESCSKLSKTEINNYIKQAEFSKLEFLNLSNTNINDDTLVYLSLKSNNVTQLNLSFCN